MPAITTPVMGHDEAMSLQVELTYGTQVVPNAAFIRPARFALTAKPVVNPLLGPSGHSMPFLYHGTVPRQQRDAPIRDGEIMVEVDYDFIGHWLAAAIGDPTGPGAGPLAGVWAFTIPSASPTAMPPSLTVSHHRVMAAGDRDLMYGGVMVNQFVMRGVPGQYVTASMECIATNGGTTTQAWPGTPVYSTEVFAELFHADIGIDATVGVAPSGTDFLSGAGADVLEWTLTVNNNLTNDPAVGGRRASANNSLAIAPPVYGGGGSRTVELAWTHSLQDISIRDLFHPATDPAGYRAVSLLLDQGADAGDGANTSLRFDMLHSLFLGDPTPYEGGGNRLVQSVRVIAAADGTNPPLTATLTNGNTTASAYGTGSN